MPRPGPRPYECVRRTWHSDRHQPIRGSLIQEIFRVVSQIHSSGTKRNKEWQEKLPIVVLKAEEIMYSKANSEAEYMDLSTLWDRANDAINTIIRREGTPETGDLLQPCIEAALHLGCIPRRTSRSQRDNDPRRYLSPNPLEPMSLRCHSMAMFSDIFNNASAMSQPQLDGNSDNTLFKNFPLNCPRLNSSVAIETRTASVQRHSVYPLYYWGDEINDAGFNILPQMPSHLNCDLSLRLGPSLGLEDTSKKPRHQEFQNITQTNSIAEELSLFPKEGDDAEYLHLDEPIQNQKRKVLSYAHAHQAEENISKLQSDRENLHIIRYAG